MTTTRLRSPLSSGPGLAATRRATSHAPTIAFALAALAWTASCDGSATPSPSPAAAAPGGQEGSLAPPLEGLDQGKRRDNPLPPPELEITDDDIMEPLVGTPTLSEAAIEIVDDEILPPDLNISAGAREEILDLLRAMQPLKESLTSDHHDRQYILNRQRVERLEREDRLDVGWAALHAFTNYPARDAVLKNRLLRIGARVSPVEARNLLVELTFNYGYPIEDRTSALEFLPEVDPAAVFEGAPAILEREGRRTQTAPEDEFFVAAWLKACDVAGEDPVPMMSSVAVNFALDPVARYSAVEALQAHADVPLARATLEQVLVESTGDGYIRRKAAQSILGGYSREEACSILTQVRSREADVNFARFLDDMVQTNCR